MRRSSTSFAPGSTRRRRATGPSSRSSPQSRSGLSSRSGRTAAPGGGARSSRPASRRPRASVPARRSS
jgi:hypothetical protein